MSKICCLLILIDAIKYQIRVIIFVIKCITYLLFRKSVQLENFNYALEILLCAHFVVVYSKTRIV